METINLQTLFEKELTTFHDKNVALLRNFKELHSSELEMTLLEEYAFIFVTSGHVSMSFDDQIYELQTNDLFVCNPHHIIDKSMFSLDFDFIVFILSNDYVEQLSKMVDIDWSVHDMLMSHQIIHCNQSDAERCMNYFNVICSKLKTPESINQHKSINMLFCSMIYDLADVVSRINIEIPAQSYTCTDNIMQRFFKLLKDRTQPFKNVNGYAESLNISPKYFSTLCKKATGKTAGTLINNEIISAAKLLLRDSSLSINQVADRLGFANQSHFGVFFRRHSGISPQQYRTSEG